MSTTSFDFLIATTDELVEAQQKHLATLRAHNHRLRQLAILELLGIEVDRVYLMRFGKQARPWKVAPLEHAEPGRIRVTLVFPLPQHLNERELSYEDARAGKYSGEPWPETSAEQKQEEER